MSNRKDCTEYNSNDIGPLGTKIQTIIVSSDDFIVYIDDLGDIYYYTTSAYKGFIKEFGSVQSRITHYESIANMQFNKAEAYQFKIGLAEAYARAIDDRNFNYANDILALTVKRMEANGSEKLKHSYILAAFRSTLFIILFIVAMIIFKCSILSVIDQDNYDIIEAALFGGVGAFIFATLRLNQYPAEISILEKYHKVDGRMRIAYGIMSGLVVAIAFKAKVAFSFLSKDDEIKNFGIIFLGILSGASDLIIPNLIKHIEKKV